MTNRSEIKTFVRKQSFGTESKLASFDLLDGKNTQMRVSMFGTDVDRFYPLVKPNTVITLARGKVRPIQSRFGTPYPSTYEITLESYSQVHVCVDDHSIPTQHYAFVSISECEMRNVHSKDNKNNNGNGGGFSSSSNTPPTDPTIDILAVVRQVHPCSSFIVKKSGKPMSKRSIVVSDQSNRSVCLFFFSVFFFFFVTGSFFFIY